MYHHSRFLHLASSTRFCPQFLSFLSTAASLPSRRDILPLCATAKSLSDTQKAHALAVVHGHLPFSVTISAALILSYAAYSAHPSTLKSLFTQSLSFSRSAFLHNTLIRASTILHRECVIDLGLLVYNDLLKATPFRPDDYTFPFVLKICADFLCVSKGLEVHGRLIKAGLDCDVFVNNTLILFYGSCGRLWNAHKVFDEMPERDLISWNTLLRVFSDNDFHLEAVGLFKNMISNSGFVPNVISIVSILPVCAALENERLVSLIHSYVIKAGNYGATKIGNSLIDAYGKCANIEALKGVFDQMIEKDEVSLNSVLAGLSCVGSNIDALVLFREMINKLAKLNSVAVATMLPTLVELSLFNKGKELHCFSMKMDMDSDVFVANALIDMYGKWGRLKEASVVFNNMPGRNIVSWNTMIGNFAQNGFELDAIRHVRYMQSHDEIPNFITLLITLPACARVGSILHGKEMHGRSIRLRSSSDVFVTNALTDMYAKCGRIDLAQNMFNISPRDEASYNILIMGYSKTSKCSNSITLFKEMENIGLKHDTVSYMGVLSACADASALKEGKEIHALATRRLFHDHLHVANSFLDMYTKCGRIDIARVLFDRIPDRDSASWNTMILGFGMIGELETALELFEAMKGDRAEYDSVSYIAVLSVCSHGGLLEKGKEYFESMLVNNVKPSEMHYACMVDLYGRNGLMEEALEIVNELGDKAGVNVWGALLGASRVHGNVELGCWAAEHLLEIKPEHPGYYVVLANMYAEAGRWDEADRVRKLMSERQVRKNPGCSWVKSEEEDQVYGFVAGQRFDPCIWNAISP